MPTFITREVYACSHCLETRHQSFGSDSAVLVETIPIPSRCLTCLCQSLLKGDYNDVDRSQTRDICSHLHAMLMREHQHRAVGMKMIRSLEKLVRSILVPESPCEFQGALHALSRFPSTNTQCVM
ncbi:hypothetical protein F4819DRAFT_459946 [Hypoxylon fuscum]|nr:hypothetical protein F4819DRAFT_459946 [Hypoxylon fuscum]